MNREAHQKGKGSGARAVDRNSSRTAHLAPQPFFAASPPVAPPADPATVD